MEENDKKMNPTDPLLSSDSTDNTETTEKDAEEVEIVDKAHPSGEADIAEQPEFDEDEDSVGDGTVGEDDGEEPEDESGDLPDDEAREGESTCPGAAQKTVKPVLAWSLLGGELAVAIALALIFWL